MSAATEAETHERGITLTDLRNWYAPIAGFLVLFAGIVGTVVRMQVTLSAVVEQQQKDHKLIERVDRRVLLLTCREDPNSSQCTSSEGAP